MASYAKNGGLVLTAAGVGMGCYNMAQTTSHHEKNEILVETLSSSLVGVLSSAAIATLLISTPAGWVTTLVLGAGATLASYGAGKGSVFLYNRYLQSVDLVKISNVNVFCN